jgi:hypothetical protein
MHWKWISTLRCVHPKYVGWQLMNYERGGKMVCRYFWPTTGATHES